MTKSQVFASKRQGQDKIPVSVVVMTKDNAKELPACLEALQGFSEVFVVDSSSQDDSASIAKGYGANVVSFSWNGLYPKKKQWCLDNLPFSHEWIFTCDVDEIVTPAFCDELQKRVNKGSQIDGFFIQARHEINGKILKYGMKNKKLALFKKGVFTYPILNDLTFEGSFEVEGHYQPQPTKARVKIETIHAPLIHMNMANENDYDRRHNLYALWEAHMTIHKCWPKDPIWWRDTFKRVMRVNPLRPLLIFLYSFVFKVGFLDGGAGYAYALKKARYAAQVQAVIRDLTHQ